MKTGLRAACLAIGVGIGVLTPLVSAQTPPSSGHVFVSIKEHGNVTVKADAEFKAIKQVGNFGKRSVMMIRRDPGSSIPEVHRQLAHILVVKSGEGTLILGGELVGRHPEPGGSGGRENGTSIRNGKEYQVAPGDTFYVPPETPHQYVVQPGKQMTILTINE